jgi:HEAT repeat protein
MAKKSRRPDLEKELAELGVALRDPTSATSRVSLSHVLLDGSSLVAARVAKSIAERHLEGFEEVLERSFQRFLQDPVNTDPGCRAKVAVLEALDRLESMNAAPFLVGTSYVQLEPGYGKPTDSAAGVRGRAIAALARIGHSDVPLAAAQLLADPEVAVRRAAADALGYHGERASAGLLWFKLHQGDDDDLVTLACAYAVLTVAPEWGLRALRPLLFGTDLKMRELCALALGEVRHDGALELLFEYVDETVTPHARVLAFGGLGVSRSERARTFLLERAKNGGATEAKAAIAALGTHAHEPGLAERVREAAEGNSGVDVRADVARAFPER